METILAASKFPPIRIDRLISSMMTVAERVSLFLPEDFEVLNIHFYRYLRPPQQGVGQGLLKM